MNASPMNRRSFLRLTAAAPVAAAGVMLVPEQAEAIETAGIDVQANGETLWHIDRTETYTTLRELLDQNYDEMRHHLHVMRD